VGTLCGTTAISLGHVARVLSAGIRMIDAKDQRPKPRACDLIVRKKVLSFAFVRNQRRDSLRLTLSSSMFENPFVSGEI